MAAKRNSLRFVLHFTICQALFPSGIYLDVRAVKDGIASRVCQIRMFQKQKVLVEDLRQVRQGGHQNPSPGPSKLYPITLPGRHSGSIRSSCDFGKEAMGLPWKISREPINVQWL